MRKLVVVAAVAAVAVVATDGHAQPPPQEAPEPPNPGAALGDTVPVSGRVVDALGKPIAGARIVVEGSEDAVTTDADGRFVTTAPINATLVIEASRYDVTLQTVLEAGPLGDVVMLLTSQFGETIEVTGEAPAAAPGAAQLDRQELQRIPGTGGDLVRALTVMPGVVNLQLPLGYNGVVIRGSSPQDSKVLIDGFEVPVLFHNIGFRAITPAETIATLDFIPGGFDVAYGRASSGIVNLTTRPGDERRSEQAEVSFIDGGLIAQGPIGKRTKYMAALRRSTIDFVLPALIPDDVDLSLTTVPRYYDEQLRIDHRIDARWKVMFSNLGTDDIFEIVASQQDDSKDKRFFNRTRFIRNTAAAIYSSGPWNANLGLSYLWQEFVFEIGTKQFIRNRLNSVTPRAEITRTAPKAAGLTDVVWRTGGELQIGRYTVDLALPVEPREGEPMPEFDPDDTSTRAHEILYTPDVATWTAVAGNLDPKLRATTGVRVDYFGRGREVAIQPRGELAYKINKPWSVRLAAGGYARPPQFQSELLEKRLQSERSTQVITGVQYQPREGIRAQASLYYTDRTKLITHAVPSNAVEGAPGDITLVNNGRGYSAGGELLGTYRGGPWFAWLSYSYSKSKRIDAPGDPERLFTFDQPHSMNAAVSWKRGKWQLGGRFQLYSGLPNTPALGSIFDSDRNIHVPIYGDVNSDRAPMHHQLDLRVDRTWRAGPVVLTGFLDVQNVYMNTSVVTYLYNYDYTQRAEFKSLPIIPSIGLRGVL